MKEWVIGGGGLTIIALALISATFTSCSNSRQTHYTLANQCVTRGGSWVDTSSGDAYKGICINLKGVQP